MPPRQSESRLSVNPTRVLSISHSSCPLAFPVIPIKYCDLRTETVRSWFTNRADVSRSFMTARLFGLLPAYLRRLWNTLPYGYSIEDTEWTRRHRGIVCLLWMHAAGMPLLGLLTS